MAFKRQVVYSFNKKALLLQMSRSYLEAIINRTRAKRRFNGAIVIDFTKPRAFEVCLKGPVLSLLYGAMDLHPS